MIITTRQIADKYLVSIRTVARWRERGMPHNRIGQRLIRYDDRAVASWLRRQKDVGHA